MADLTKNVKDAAYVVVGAGVLAFQRAQVRRRELGRRLADPRQGIEAQLGELRGQVARLAKDLDGRLDPVVGQLDAQLDRVEHHLPDQARGLLHLAREQARGTRELFRLALGAADGSSTSAAA